MLCDFSSNIQKQSVSLLHNVCFVDNGHFFAIVFESEIKGIASNALSFGSGHDFERLDNSRNGLQIVVG